ncbi:MAG: acyltransferase [Nitrospiraceae bacterium]|nr:acyltransferase [Nitrospiraceae bacterium]
MAFAAFLLMASPFILLSRLEEMAAHGESVFYCLANFFALFPGKVGSYLRSAFYYGALKRCDWETYIGFGTFFSHRSAEVGKNVAIGAYCIIGSASIGDNVMIASRVSILSGKHQHIDDSGQLVRSPIFEKISIGEDSWVGEGAILMDDVGEKSIISAGAVVTRKAAPNSKLMGKPARNFSDIGKAGLETK